MLNILRNAGFGAVQPARIAATMASSSSPSPRNRRPRAYPPERTRSDAARVSCRVRDGDCRSLGDAEQREALQAHRIDDRFEIADPHVDRRIADFRVREPQPRSSYRTTVCRSPSPFSQWRHTGLSQSNSR